MMGYSESKPLEFLSAPEHSSGQPLGQKEAAQQQADEELLDAYSRAVVNGAEKVGPAEPSVMQVASIEEGGPARQAGLHEGD
jgi:hypothetical protein